MTAVVWLAVLRGAEPDVWGGSRQQQLLLQSICSPDVEGGGAAAVRSRRAAFVQLTSRNCEGGVM